ncbi:DUF6777 domain-containing protein [Streptomyces sp. MB22_4]|uniref:DUF6777 domain-containing protein n=1 Tax=Streptomyces sp. MB22_4 TaxID=3383120 RepID=UPI00399FCDA1
MRIPTGSMVMACVLLSVALLLTGCAGAAVKEAQLGEEVFLQPAAEQGPNPFTASTATGPAGPGTPRPTGTGRAADASAPPAGLAVAPLAAARALSGGTPGLYSGSARVAGCDVERQIGGLTSDPARGDAFARTAGVPRAELPGYLRGLTPVLLRADTRVTNHGYRDGQVAGYQAVLQAGTAVLVDNRGVPRVRCACGNPLRPPEEARGGVGARGTAWSGYRPNQVIVVTPAPQTVGSLTLLDAGTNTWIERRVGPDVRKDRLVAPPAVSDTAPPDPGLTGFPHPSRPPTARPSPRDTRSNTATGEMRGAVIDAGRVTSGRGPGAVRGEEAGERRARADGAGAGAGGRGVRAVRRGAAGTGRDGGRPDGGDHDASRAGGHGTHAAGERGSAPPDTGSAPAPTDRGTSATTNDGSSARTNRGTSVNQGTSDTTDRGTPARTNDGTSVNQGTSGTTDRGTSDTTDRGTPARTNDGTPVNQETSATRDRGTSATTDDGIPTADAHGTPAADDQGTPAPTAPGTPSPTPTTSSEPRAALPTRALGSASASPAAAASSSPSDSPTRSTPSTPPASSAPSGAPALRDPLAYPPDTSLYNPAPFGAPPSPQAPDEIGPPNVTETPALPDPDGADAPAPGGAPGGAGPTPADVLGG